MRPADYYYFVHHLDEWPSTPVRTVDDERVDVASDERWSLRIGRRDDQAPHIFVPVLAVVQVLCHLGGLNEVQPVIHLIFSTFKTQ